MELYLWRQIQVLEAQISTTTAIVETIPATSTAQIETIPIQTPSCSIVNAYNQPVFCPNQTLPSFCPATSTREAWDHGANEYGGDWSDKYIYIVGNIGLSDDQLIQCGMLPR